MKSETKKNHKSNSRTLMVAALLSLLVLLTGAGCSMLEDPYEASPAYVTIQNHTPEEIAQTTARVFTAEGYVGRIPAPGQMIFEKELPHETVRPGDVPTTGYYDQTIIRVKASLTSREAGGYKLESRAFKVTGGSDPFLQNEDPLPSTRRRPYQDLLDKVAQQLR